MIYQFHLDNAILIERPTGWFSWTRRYVLRPVSISVGPTNAVVTYESKVMTRLADVEVQIDGKTRRRVVGPGDIVVAHRVLEYPQSF